MIETVYKNYKYADGALTETTDVSSEHTYAYIQDRAENGDESHTVVQCVFNIIHSDEAIESYQLEDIALELTDIDYDTVDFQFTEL